MAPYSAGSRAHLEERLAGILLGTAVGDSLGLPREGLPRQRARRLFGGRPLRHRFLFGRGMMSDDSEQACMVGQALLASRGEPGAFARSLAWRLRWWLLGLPAGIGKATLRAICRLWIGFPPGKSGVHSAGNGAAMRAPVLGAIAAGDDNAMARLVEASTRLTHADGRAYEGALAVAVACGYAVSRAPDAIDADELFGILGERISDEELTQALGRARSSLAAGAIPEAFAAELGLSSGVSAYVVHTVAVSIFCWLRHRADFRRAVEEAIALGGDADTVGAITGALAGATLGASAIPREWLAGVIEWPRSVGWMRRLAARLAAFSSDRAAPVRPLRLFWPALIVRNLIFLAAVLIHGFRRLLPPY